MCLYACFLKMRQGQIHGKSEWVQLIVSSFNVSSKLEGCVFHKCLHHIISLHNPFQSQPQRQRQTQSNYFFKAKRVYPHHFDKACPFQRLQLEPTKVHYPTLSIFIILFLFVSQCLVPSTIYLLILHNPPFSCI